MWCAKWFSTEDTGLQLSLHIAVCVFTMDWHNSNSKIFHVFGCIVFTFFQSALIFVHIHIFDSSHYKGVIFKFVTPLTGMDFDHYNYIITNL